MTKDARRELTATFDPMHALQRVLSHYPGGVPALARSTGQSPRLLHARMSDEEGAGKRTLSLRLGFALLALADTEHTFLREWARAEGGVFIPLPSSQPADDDVLDDLIALTESLGAFAHKLRDARADGVVTPDEFEQQLAAAQSIHERLQQLMADLSAQVRTLPPSSLKAVA